MADGSARDRAMEQTHERILEVARELLGQHPNAGMAEIAAAASVVRRTVYGHFPNRDTLVHELAERGAQEMAAVLRGVDAETTDADRVWAGFVVRLWPLVGRYRVLLALRRGEHGADIHRTLGTVDDLLTNLVLRGQRQGVFGDHLPAAVLAQVSYGIVFSIADHVSGTAGGDGRAAIRTSLLALGVPAERADTLAAAGVADQPRDLSPAPPASRNASL